MLPCTMTKHENFGSEAEWRGTGGGKKGLKRLFLFHCSLTEALTWRLFPTEFISSSARSDLSFNVLLDLVI